ncbi:hypothetical protein, partial [Tenacibaculum amylolyticum]|uniref:hypothetical protein n=1 Tax=Tenacibaculum amylolyticum TaxID=104269 RepID=UPI0038B65641
MKRITLITFLLLFLQGNIVKSQTTLQPGDIAFTHMDRDGSDLFSIVLLVDITSNTVIHFSERTWDGSAWLVTNSEGILTFTSDTPLTAGTQLLINKNTPSATIFGGSTTGNIVLVAGSWSASAGGDQIFAYQSANALTPNNSDFIAAINSDDDNLQANGWHLASNTSSSASSLPTNLTNGTNALSLYISGSPLNAGAPDLPGGGERENARYKASAPHTGDKATILAAIMDLNNWEADDDTPYNNASAAFTITGGNTDPTIAIDNSTLNYTEGNSATQIDATGTVNDADGDADWNGGTLVTQITANAEAADEISISDTDGDGTAITVSGTNILANGTTVGVLSASGGTVTNNTALTITFNSNATNAIVQEVLQSLRYRNTSTTPGTSNRTITITATDSNAASVNDTRTITITTIPNVTSVTVPSNATYSVGQNLDFAVNFDENITVNTTGGTPQLAITIGSTTRQAVFQPASSGTSALTFRYTVQAGDSDTDGIAVGSLSANGGTLQNGSGTAANLTLNNVGSTANVFVDGIVPTGYSVAIDQSPINAANDDAVSFTFAGA